MTSGSQLFPMALTTLLQSVLPALKKKRLLLRVFVCVCVCVCVCVLACSHSLDLHDCGCVHRGVRVTRHHYFNVYAVCVKMYVDVCVYCTFHDKTQNCCSLKRISLVQA